MALNLKHKEIIQSRRIEFAISEISKRGFKITPHSSNENIILFKHKGAMVKLYAFTGWYTGKTIRPGRGIHNLLKEVGASRKRI